MANEIKVSGSLQVNEPSVSNPFKRQFRDLEFDLNTSGANMAGGFIDVVHTGGSGSGGCTPLTLTNITNPGWTIMYNHDSTNFVQFGDDPGAAFEPSVRIEPGEFALFRMSQGMTAPSVLADTATVRLEYYVWED